MRILTVLQEHINLEALSCTISPRAGGQSISKAVSIPSVVHSARDGSTRKRNYYCRVLPLLFSASQSIFCCYHGSRKGCSSSHLISQIYQTFPSIFAYCKRSNTGGGNVLGTRLLVCAHINLTNGPLLFSASQSVFCCYHGSRKGCSSSHLTQFKSRIFHRFFIQFHKCLHQQTFPRPLCVTCRIYVGIDR